MSAKHDGIYCYIRNESTRQMLVLHYITNNSCCVQLDPDSLVQVISHATLRLLPLSLPATGGGAVLVAPSEEGRVTRGGAVAERRLLPGRIPAAAPVSGAAS